MKELPGPRPEFKITPRLENRRQIRLSEASGHRRTGRLQRRQVRELVAYARARHIEISAFAGASHMAYVLKHPEFAPCAKTSATKHDLPTKDASWKLIFDMYERSWRNSGGPSIFTSPPTKRTSLARAGVRLRGEG